MNEVREKNFQTFQTRLAVARQVNGGRGDGFSIIKNPEPFNPASVEDEVIKEAFGRDHWGDGDLTRRIVKGRYCRDVLTVKEGGEGGQFYKWGGDIWRPDDYSSLSDFLRPLPGLYERLTEPMQEEAREIMQEVSALRTDIGREKKKEEPKFLLIKSLESQVNDLLEKHKEIRAKIKPLASRAKACCQRPRRKHIINDAFSAEDMQFDGRRWNSRIDLLPCLNGTLDLKNGVLIESLPEHYFNKIVPWNFTGLDTPCPLFRDLLFKALGRDEALVDYFLSCLGLALTGIQTKEVFFCLGTSADNGKSTVFDILSMLLGGEEGFCINGFKIANFLYTGLKSSEAPEAGLMQLMGARVTISSEPSERDFIDLGKLKLLSSGGDNINARALNSNRLISFKQTQTSFIHCNQIPRCYSGDQGLHSRARIIVWPARFLSPYDLPEEKPEEHLYHAIPRNRLMSGIVDEMSGILGLLATYAMKAFAECLPPPPPCVTSQIKTYLLENDIVAQFIEAKCLTGPEMYHPARNFYEAFREWLIEEMGYEKNKVPTMTRFGLMMKNKYEKRDKYKGSKGYSYVGVTLIPPDLERSDQYTQGGDYALNG